MKTQKLDSPDATVTANGVPASLSVSASVAERLRKVAKPVERFIVSKNLPPEKRREGYRFEVIDCTHPSDGGPVAVAWFFTEELANRRAEELNESDAELRFEARAS